QGTLASLPKVAPLVEIRSESPEGPKPLTRTIDLAEDSGFSVEMWIRLDHSQPGRILVDNRDATNRGFVISLGEENSYQVELNDGLHSFAWSSDPGTIQVGKRQHVVIIVDSGPKLMMFVVDGQLCDGGEHRQYGWARWTDDLRQVTGQSIWINPALKDCIHSLRIFGRPLRVSEAVSLYRAGSH
ncbi:MAG: LamG domain-containing protein, partial [Thermogutta sp.]